MRIAFLNRGRVHPGGDLVALDETMAALRKRGHTCVETGWDRAALKAGGFDLAHIYHCNFDWSWGNYEAVRDVGLKYVLTPIYYPQLWSGISRDQLGLQLSRAEYILPFSNREIDQMRAESMWTERWHYAVIPNGTSPKFHDLNHTTLTTHPSVLCVSARGLEDKGIPMVRRICERLGVDFFPACEVLPDQLRKWYDRSLVFVNASTSERMSLTTGEALCAGCRVLDTNQNWGGEHYPGLVRFDPTDEGQLERLIRWALVSPHWDYRPNEFARTLTWDYHAECLERVYKEVCNA